MKDAKIEIFPFGVFLSPLLLNKPVSVVLRSVIAPLNRNAPLNPISPATSAFPYSTLFGFVNVAELIGTATTSKRGLMPSRLVPVDDTSGVTSINLNTSKSIGRVYAGLRTIFSNYPTGLTYPYMGAFNLGYTSNGQLIQFLFSNDDSGNYAVHHRCYYAGNNWTEWKKLL